jgi:hypothetical protein
MSSSTIHSTFTPSTGLPNQPPEVSAEENMGTMESGGQQYYYFKIGEGQTASFYMFESPEARQQFTEWLSLTTGANINDLSARDITKTLNDYQLVEDYQTTTGQVTQNGNRQTVWMTFIKAPLEQKLEGQAKQEFFGGDTPYFAEGSAPYLAHRDISLTGDSNSDGAKLAGLSGSARFLFDSNYGQKETKPVDTNTLDKGLQDLAKSLFGDVPLTEEHLNIIKMMGFVKGDASQGASTWTLSEAGTAANDAFKTPGNAAYLASINLNSLSPEDLLKAGGASTYFTDGGFAKKQNSSETYGTKDVETLAREALGKMKGADETLPAGLKAAEGQEEKVTKLITDLLGLPASTTFDQLTPSQVNAAIATGMVSYNKDTNTLSTTLNGETYFTEKTKQTENSTQPESTDPAKKFYDGMSTFYQLGGATGADRAEVNDKKGVKNDRFGTYGIGKLAGASATDDNFWKNVGLGHLSQDDRTKLINASKDILQYGGDQGSNGYLDKISTWGQGSGLGLGVFRSSQIQEWLKNNQPK